jgi:hypothetical protein
MKLTTKSLSDNTPVNTGSQELCGSPSLACLLLLTSESMPGKNGSTTSLHFGFALPKAAYIFCLLAQSAYLQLDFGRAKAFYTPVELVYSVLGNGIALDTHR